MIRNAFYVVAGLFCLHFSTTETLAREASDEAAYGYHIQPSAAQPVNMISSIKIQFPEARYLGVYAPTCDGVTLTRDDDPSEVYVPVDVQYSDNNYVLFNLKPKSSGSDAHVIVTDPGRYTLHVPAGTFTLYGPWLVKIGSCDEIRETYTVSDDGDSGYDNYFTSWTLSPSPGQLKEITTITISFPVTAANPVLDVPNFNLIRLRKADDSSVVYEPTQIKYDYESTVQLSFKPEGSSYPNAVTVMDVGEYILDIPAGTFALSGTDIVNPAIAERYIVEGPNVNSFINYTIDPAPGGTYEKISEITIEYPDLESGFNFTDGLTDVVNELNGSVTLVRLDEDEYYQSTYIPHSAIVEGGNKVTFRFRNQVASSPEPSAETITANGDYLLTVPANTFKEKGDMFSFNPRIEAYYTINRTVPANSFDNHVFDPAEGASVGSLETMSVTFPDLQNGFDYPIDYSGIKLVKEGEADVSYKVVNFMVGKNTLSWGFNVESVTEDLPLKIYDSGRYTLTIPAGILSEYENPSMTNGEISCSFTIDSDLLFEYSLSPDPEMPLGALPAVCVSVASPDLGITVNPGCSLLATISSSAQSYVLEPVQESPEQINFVMPEDLGYGVWTVKFPAGYFIKINANGAEVQNPDEITARYQIVSPTQYDYSVYPKSGSSMTGLTNVSISLTGSGLRQIELDPSVGEPVLSGVSGSLKLSGTISENSVNISVPKDASLAAGEYSLAVPEGYIITTDAYGLKAALPEIVAVYTITEYDAPDFSEGIFFINEGWYGTDYGSVNFMTADYDHMEYTVYQQANKGAHLGVTSQFGEIFGNRIYIMSKQAAYTSDSDDGGVLVVADAATMEKVAALSSIGSADGRSICGVNAGKAYIGTDSGIFVFNRDDNTVGDAIEGTTSDDGHYNSQIGDMVRLGGYVFAVRQDLGVYVIDSDTDCVVATLPLPSVLSVFVTAEGNIFAATSDDASEFVKIDSETFEMTPVDVTSQQKATLANRWSSWTKAPLAVAISGNAVYYATADNSSEIACYDFDSDTFTAAFVSLPWADSQQQVLYGTGLSVDPVSGYIVLQAVEAGGGTHYSHSRVYFANAMTGEINHSMTFELEPYYWFPAMAVYPVSEAPRFAAFPEIRLSADGKGLPSTAEIDLAASTSLGIGNRHLIVYGAEAVNPAVCSVTALGDGLFEVQAASDGETELRLTADYRGVVTETSMPVKVGDDAGITDVTCEEEIGDIVTTTGIIVRHNVRLSDTEGLTPGLYLFKNRKIIVK